MSHDILNNLDIQICLRHTGTCGMSENVGSNGLQLFRLSPLPLRPLIFLFVIRLHNIPQNEIDRAWHHGASASAHKHEIRQSFDLYVSWYPRLKIQPSLGLKGFPHHLAHRNHPDSGLCLQQSLMEITDIPVVFIGQLVIHGNGPFFHVHIFPCQSDQFPAPEPRSDHHLQHRQIILKCLAVLHKIQQIFLLVKGQGSAFLFRLSIISQRSFCRILPDDIIIYGHLKTGKDHIMEKLDGTVGVFFFTQPGIKQPHMGWSHLYHFHLTKLILHKTIPHPSVIGIGAFRQLPCFQINVKQLIERYALELGIGQNLFVLIFLDLFFFFPEFGQIRGIDSQTPTGPFVHPCTGTYRGRPCAETRRSSDFFLYYLF